MKSKSAKNVQKEKIVINDLLNYKDLKIIQNTDYFMFSLDSILLANFVKINTHTKHIMDFCTGNAPIPLILSKKVSDSTEIVGVELQKEIFNLAVDSVNLNNLSSKIKIINKNIKDIFNEYESDSFDVITCNPPYFKYNSKASKINENIIKSIARHEIEISLEEIIITAKKLLKNNGSLYLVHRTDRLIDIIKLMKDNNIEPKIMRFIYPKKNLNSNIILICGTKNGNSGLKILNPLFVHNENGDYSEEVLKMFS